jgi:hypothetical protein
MEQRVRPVLNKISLKKKPADIYVIQKYFYPHDAKAIPAIKLTQRPTGQFCCLEYGKQLTLYSQINISIGSGASVQISSHQANLALIDPLGDRPVWDSIWKANVQHKICIFGWRAATVLENIDRRSNTTNPTFFASGSAKEDTHHALLECTLAKALRDGMRSVWTCHRSMNSVKLVRNGSLS